MYYFAIIDDNNFDSQLVSSQLQKECKKHNIEYQLDIYKNPLNFDQGKYYDALFVDMEMPEEDGFSFAKRIQNLYDTKIIIITNHNEYRYSGYDIHPFQFINKLNIKEMSHVCNQLFDYLNKQTTYITGYVDNRKKNISIKNIYYIQVDDHICYLYLHKNTKSIYIRSTISKLEQVYHGDGLIRINRSTLINKIHIKDVKKDKVILKNNVTLTISPVYAKKFNKYYQDCLWGLL